MCRASAMIEQDMALGLSRMNRVTSVLATLDGTGATCLEVSMKQARSWKHHKLVRHNAESGCWEWIGATSSDGYGRVRFRGRRTGLHRITFQVQNGEVPDDMVIDHVCRNRKCCNPAHLRCVTPRDNALQNSVGIAQANAAKEKCPRCGSRFQPTKFKTKDGTYRDLRYCRPCKLKQMKDWRRKNPRPGH